MPEVLGAVQPRAADRPQPVDHDAVRTYLSEQFDQDTDRSRVFCRAERQFRGVGAELLLTLLQEVEAARSCSGAGGPTPAQQPHNRLPASDVYKSSGISEFHEGQEFHESKECQGPPSGLARALPNEPSQQREEPPQTSIPDDPIQAAIELARQIALEASRRGQIFQGEALWSWPFRLARRLLHWEEITKDRAKRAVRAFADTIRKSWPNYRPWPGVGFDDLYLGFCDAFNKVNVPEGQDSLERAADQARKHPVVLKSGDLPDLCRRIAGVAYYLWQLTPEGTFILPQERLAKLFAVAQMTVSRSISLLVSEGVLAVVCPEYSRAKRQAKVYRWAAAEGTYTVRE